MTFSICVRERYTDEDGEEQTRFGVAVTTRLVGVGTMCPFASENGAVATQSVVNIDLGRKGIEYMDDGLAVEDALQSLLNADDGSAERQLHGVGHDGEFAFSGDECNPWYGHAVGDNYTVAGNLLAGESVVDSVAETYESAAPAPGESADEPLARRLVDALAAGHAEGGDKREELHVQSAALVVTDTEDREMDPYYNDLRVDASETPIQDLGDTLELAREGYEMVLDRWSEDGDGDGSESEE
ncbi:MAG: DUF1028 domain-containing protein [Haloarculaceae archaeon]